MGSMIQYRSPIVAQAQLRLSEPLGFPDVLAQTTQYPLLPRVENNENFGHIRGKLLLQSMFLHGQFSRALFFCCLEANEIHFGVQLWSECVNGMCTHNDFMPDCSGIYIAPQYSADLATCWATFHSTKYILIKFQTSCFEVESDLATKLCAKALSSKPGHCGVSLCELASHVI